jgi:transposase-like protein
MDKGSVLQALGQVSAEEAGEVFREYLRGATREMLVGVMTEEVTALCGVAYHPNEEGQYYRAGSAEGYAYVESRREEIVRPRVRRQEEDETTEEVTLESYRAAQDASEAQRLLLEALVGRSTRRVGNVVHNQRGSSKSSVCRLWQKVGREKFAQLRRRPLDVDSDGNRRDWLALMLDGVALAKDVLAVVAVGITVEGWKVVLDFEVGASENVTVASAVVTRIVERGFATSGDRPLLAVLDGSVPLRKAVLKHFPDARIQRCLVHKERNLKKYLARRYWPELEEYFSRLRKVEGGEAALEVIVELDRFLEGKNKSAHESLHEAGLDLIRVHLLETPSTLHVSFLSTNMIENTFRNFRHESGRVNRWRRETDQAMRWLATGLLTAEAGFHRLSHYRDLTVLVARLATRKDEENLKALREELPDWLWPESELDGDEYSGQGLRPLTPFELPTPVLTGQGV